MTPCMSPALESEMLASVANAEVGTCPVRDHVFLQRAAFPKELLSAQAQETVILFIFLQAASMWS